MARRAVFCAHLARRTWVIRRGATRIRSGVAGQAFLIVGERIAHKLFMRVVAGHASQASIPFFSPATALLQAVRLRANVADSLDAAELYVPPSTVVRAAEIDRIRRAQLAGIEYQVSAFSGFPRLALHRRHFLRNDVSGTGTVARFTGNPGHEPGAFQLAINRGTSRMAGKTTKLLFFIHRTRHGLFQVMRLR